MTVLLLGDKSVELNRGEKLIWQGRPVQGILCNPAHIGCGAVLLAAGLWLAIAKAAIFWAVPVLLAGGYLAYYHAIVEKNRRAGTYYAITNQRAIFAYSLRVLVHPITPTSAITLKTGRFDTVIISADRPSTTQLGTPLSRIGFGHLENGQKVFDLLMKLKQEA